MQTQLTRQQRDSFDRFLDHFKKAKLGEQPPHPISKWQESCMRNVFQKVLAIYKTLPLLLTPIINSHEQGWIQQNMIYHVTSRSYGNELRHVVLFRVSDKVTLHIDWEISLQPKYQVKMKDKDNSSFTSIVKQDSIERHSSQQITQGAKVQVKALPWLSGSGLAQVMKVKERHIEIRITRFLESIDRIVKTDKENVIIKSPYGYDKTALDLLYVTQEKIVIRAEDNGTAETLYKIFRRTQASGSTPSQHQKMQTPSTTNMANLNKVVDIGVYSKKWAITLKNVGAFIKHLVSLEVDWSTLMDTVWCTAYDRETQQERQAPCLRSAGSYVDKIERDVLAILRQRERQKKIRG